MSFDLMIQYTVLTLLRVIVNHEPIHNQASQIKEFNKLTIYRLLYFTIKVRFYLFFFSLSLSTPNNEKKEI